MVGRRVPFVQPGGKTNGVPVNTVGWQPLDVKIKLVLCTGAQAGDAQQIFTSCGILIMLDVSKHPFGS